VGPLDIFLFLSALNAATFEANKHNSAIKYYK